MSSLSDEHLYLQFACIIRHSPRALWGTDPFWGTDGGSGGSQGIDWGNVSGLLEVGPHRASVGRLQVG